MLKQLENPRGDAELWSRAIAGVLKGEASFSDLREKLLAQEFRAEPRDQHRLEFVRWLVRHGKLSG